MIQAGWLQSLSRADFLKSVGLYVMRDRVVLVRLSKDLFRLSVLEQQVRELEAGADPATRRHSLSQAIRSLLPHFNPARDPCFLCLSLDQAVGCQVLLPQAVGENLPQVLNYEVERFLPFRRDGMYYDYVPGGKKGDKLSVMLFAVPKKTVDEILDVLVVFGVKPRGVETTATALANYLLFCTGGGTGPAILLGGQNGSYEMIGVDTHTDGWRRQPAEMLFAYSVPGVDWVQAPARELLHDLAGDNSRLYTWDANQEVVSKFVGAPVSATSLDALGRERLSGEFQLNYDVLVPAIGTALRGLREARFAVNLLPPESRQAEARALSRLNTFLLVLLLLALVGWGVSYPLKDEIRLRQLQAENQKIAPGVVALRQKEDELNRAKKELAVVSSLRQRRGEILHVLDELSRLVPNTAYISNLRYRDGTIELQGSAENASNLVPMLERSPLFRNVGFNAPSNRSRDNRETFSLKAEVESARLKEKKP